MFKRPKPRSGYVPTFHACLIKDKYERRLTRVACFSVADVSESSVASKDDMTNLKSAGSLDGMSIPIIKPVSTYTNFNE